MLQHTISEAEIVAMSDRMKALERLLRRARPIIDAAECDDALVAEMDAALKDPWERFLICAARRCFLATPRAAEASPKEAAALWNARPREETLERLLGDARPYVEKACPFLFGQINAALKKEE
jgi:hypothetical protein